jgi:uncharacterized membrane protein YbhN (UPF0104 family)
MLKNKVNITSEGVFKVVIGILACSFLLYSLFTFDGYDQLLLSFKEGDFFHWHSLFVVILLIPANWYLESVKWKTLLKDVEQISLRMSFYSVLTGLTTGIFSPARLGEFAGRVLLLQPENRKTASALWIIGSITMTIAVLLFGIPALFLFIQSGREIDLLQSSSVTYYLIIVLLSVSFLILLYFLVPRISRFFSGRFSGYFSSIFDVLKKNSFSRLLNILVLSLLRYLVFCLQFWLMLYFFGVELSLWEACVGIFTSYLFITFLPSFFLTEAAVKSSIFLLVLSAFSGNSVAIICASMLLWILNLAIPTALGVLLLAKKRVR